MTTDDLRAKLERATPGPWELATVERPLRIGDAYSDDGWTTEFVGYDITASSEGTVVHDPSDGLQREEDANLIVSLVNAAPTLLDQAARVEALEGALRQLYVVADELDGDLDEQCYDARLRDDFDAPDDAEYGVNISAGQLRALTKALHAAALALGPLSSPASTSPSVGGGDDDGRLKPLGTDDAENGMTP